MKRFRLSPLVIAALAMLLGGAVSAGADVHYMGGGVGKSYECHHDAGPHPAKMELVQYLDQQYEGWTSARLAVGYNRGGGDLAPGPAGRVVARAKLLRADGSRVRLGTVRMGLTSFDDGRAGNYVTELIEMPLHQGDRVRWRVRFFGVPDLDPGEWIDLGVSVGTAETFEDP